MQIVLTELENTANELSLAFGKVIIGRQGYSSYELWQQAGNSGTIEDYLEYIKQPSTEAAQDIRESAAELEGTILAAETARQQAETLRSGAETDRRNAEAIRASSEEGRLGKEDERVAAERLRVYYEDTRQYEEGRRVVAEQYRKAQRQAANTAESTRASNETIRIENEDTRKENEIGRINAEADRIENVDSLITGSATALADAQEANRIANDANTLAGETIQAAQEATEETIQATEEALVLVNRVSDLEVTRIDGAFAENGLLYLTIGGVPIGSGIEVGSGTGGGGGVSTDTTVLIRLTSGFSSTFAAAHGAEAMLHYTFSSVYNSDQAPTGDGSAVYFVNGVQVATQRIAQGDRAFNVGPYLNAGSNRASVVVTDALGSGRTLQYSITAVVLSISSNFNAAIAHDTAINFKYTPIGSINKTVCFDIDGERIATFETLLTGRELTQVIPAQTHGAHLFEVYIETEIGGVIATSNVLRYDIICLEAGNNTPIIASAYNTTEAMQYETINIPYIVYTPNLIESTIDLKINDVVLSSLVVDRTQQTWSYRANLQQPLTMEIVCGAASKSFTISIESSIVDAQAVSADLDLFLTSAGRSNNEINKNVWEFGDIQAQFNGFTWVTDGWIMDDDGNIAMRVQNDARLYIPFNIFGTDFRAYGKTIEIEFAIRNVNDFYTTAISCLYNNRGFNVDVQSATLRSEQSSVSTKFKENERVRVSYVVESRYANRLILIYINGVLSGAAQYPQEDNFMQAVPTGISIGSNGCTTDIYNIRVYNNDLNSFELLENYVADMDDIERKLYLFNRNNIYDEYGNIVYERVLQQLPCMILKGTLPTFKGDKKPIDVVYEDAQVPGNSFTYTSGANLVIDVQGTSSQYYPRKNYKLKTKKGTFIQNGVTVASGLYKLRENSIPANVFCFKADFAEASGTHNTGLAKLTDDILRAIGVLTPPQRNEDPAMPVRTSVDGFPIVIFHQETSESPVTFLGKYNFNLDKGAVDSYGFTDEDITESWEFRNNTSPRCLFRSDDFTGDEWMNDFEARFPDLDEPFDDTTNLQVLFSWILSLDPSGATGDVLAAPVTYEGVEYTNDTAEYRVAKFKDEAEEHFNLQNILSYYLITELFGMTDQRAKNQFLTSWGNEGSGAYKWYMIFYDNDTALGINNEGLNIFGYDIEYHDSAVWNGESSLLWELVELAFFDDILSLYQDMRTQNIVSYELAFNYLNEEQSEKWAEAIYNADGKYKYIDPGIEQNNWTYLYAAQGSRAEHRKWWLYNRFRYMDSKYTAGDYQSDFATMRLYTPSGELAVRVNHNFVITPFADQYTRVKFGSYLVGGRSYANTPITIEAPIMTFNDTETIIYGASRITSFGSLADKYAGTVDLSAATNLTEIIIGSSVEGYNNPYLHSLYVGNSSMLKILDIQNCSGLTQAVDLSHCENIEEVYAQGTNITAVLLPASGNIKKLYLPGSIANLSLLNQPQLTDEYFSIESVELLNTIRIEGAPNLNVLSLLQQCLALEDVVLERVRITGINWETEWATTIARLQSLSAIGGLDENGNNTPNAVLTGDITLTDTATPAEYVEIVEYMETAFPYLNFHFAHKARLFTYSLEDSVLQTNPYIVFDGSEEVFYFADYPEGLIYYSSDAISGIISAYGSPEVSFSYGAITEDVAHNIYVRKAYKRTFNLTVTGGGIPINGYVELDLPTGKLKIDADEHGQVVVYQENAVDAVIGADNGETYPLILRAIETDRTYDITLNILYKVEFVIRDIDDEIIEGAYVSITGESEPRYPDEAGSVVFYTKLAIAGSVGAEGKVAIPFSHSAPSSNIEYYYILLEDSVIVFDDLNVEAICLSKWDTDNDGLLYVGDIANVTTLGDTFKGNTNIVSFNELYYFVGLISIGNDAFRNCSGLESITIPGGVTSIGVNAFEGCSSLTSIFLPDGVTLISDGAFYNCRGLTSISLPDGVTFIGESAFTSCIGITSIILPDRLTSIGYYAFAECRGLTSITLPEGLISIGGSAFYDCRGLTSITIPDGVTSIGSQAFNSCTKLTSITLPDGVTEIGSSTFRGCSSLTSITIPDRVTHIRGDAFRDCSRLSSITIPDGLTTIEGSTFRDCSSLASITIPNGVTVIGSSTFRGCSSLTSITLPEGLISIEGSAFYNCSRLSSITIPDGVTSIASSVFSGCTGLTSIVMLPITPPTLGGAIGTVISGNEKIFVPAISTHAYMVASNWASNKDQMVGQEAFLSGATLPDYSGATYTTCTWYSDSACTTTVSGSTAPSDGTYYCKLTA